MWPYIKKYQRGAPKVTCRNILKNTNGAEWTEWTEWTEREYRELEVSIQELEAH